MHEKLFGFPVKRPGVNPTLLSQRAPRCVKEMLTVRQKIRPAVCSLLPHRIQMGHRCDCPPPDKTRLMGLVPSENRIVSSDPQEPPRASTMFSASRRLLPRRRAESSLASLRQRNQPIGCRSTKMDSAHPRVPGSMTSGGFVQRAHPKHRFTAGGTCSEHDGTTIGRQGELHHGNRGIDGTTKERFSLGGLTDNRTTAQLAARRKARRSNTIRQTAGKPARNAAARVQRCRVAHTLRVSALAGCTSQFDFRLSIPGRD